MHVSDRTTVRHSDQFQSFYAEGEEDHRKFLVTCDWGQGFYAYL